MKALFLVFHGFDNANGISKKIHYQVNALKASGVDTRLCYYDVRSDGHCCWIIDEEVVVDLGTGVFAKIKKRFCFEAIFNYVEKEKIDLVYIRSYHNANPFTTHLVKKMRTHAKVVMEIPTYPYDQEYIGFRMKLDLSVDRCFRRSFAKNLDKIVTFSSEQQIFGKQTIRISNGIDFSAILVKQQMYEPKDRLHLIGVAEVHYWHGFDRLIKGLAAYYQTKPEQHVYFHIVGHLSGERERREILTVVREHALEPYVIFHGARYGSELDALFEQADLAVGSLGRHRSGITNIKTLKNREYAARGIPFIYSEVDTDFESMPYILKVSPDERPIDVDALIEFRHTLKMQPTEIRESVKHLSWQSQMSNVIHETFE